MLGFFYSSSVNFGSSSCYPLRVSPINTLDVGYYVIIECNMSSHEQLDYNLPEAIDDSSALRILEGSSVFFANEAQDIIDRTNTNKPLVDVNSIAKTIEQLGSDKINPFGAVVGLATCSREMSYLLAGSVGVKEGYKLHEHTQAVLSRFEDTLRHQSYAGHGRKLLRTALLLQDMGKPLAVSLHGSNEEQTVYNKKLVSNILSVVPEDTLSTSDKQMIEILTSHDIVGGAIQGKLSLADAKNQIEDLVAVCPDEHKGQLANFIRTMYLCDATAYTSHAKYRETALSKPKRSKPTLNFLFKRDEADNLGFRFDTHRRIFDSLTENILKDPVQSLGKAALDRDSFEMYEDVILPAKILRDVDLLSGFKLEDFKYDQELGCLTLPQTNGMVRAVMFRGHVNEVPRQFISARELANRPPESREIQNSLYGTGLYMGNTAQSVDIFGWGEGKTVSVFLSPPFSEDAVMDMRYSGTWALATAGGIGHFVTRGIVMRTFGRGTALNSTDASYGDSGVVVLDVGVDTRLIQNIQAKRHIHDISPVWYILRDADAELELVGSITRNPVEPRRLFRGSSY